MPAYTFTPNVAVESRPVWARPRAMIFSRSAAKRDWSKRSAIQRRDQADSASQASCPDRAPIWSYMRRISRTCSPGMETTAAAISERPGQQRLVGHHLDHQAPVAGRLGVDVVAGEAHAPGPVGADQLRQPHGQAASGHHADPGVGVGEASPLRGDEEVAVERDLEAPGHGGAVHGRDDRRLVRRDHPDVLGRVGHALPLDRAVLAGEVLEVHPGAEGGVGAGQDHAADVVAPVELGDGASNSRLSSAEMALRASGRFNVTVATRSATSTSTTICVPSQSCRRAGRVESLEDDQAADRSSVVEGPMAQPSTAVTPRSTLAQVNPNQPWCWSTAVADLELVHPRRQVVSVRVVPEHRSALRARPPLLREQGEAIGITLFAVDALPAAQCGLTHEAGRLGGAGRRHVPRLDEEMEAGDARPAEGEIDHGAQGVGGQATAPEAFEEPVADRGPPALDFVEPQADRTDPRCRRRFLGDDERDPVALGGPPVLALDEGPSRVVGVAARGPTRCDG